MTTAPRLWPNSTVVCLATGPSLTPEDCDYVRGKAHVVAINDAHRLAPWAECLYSSDRDWWPYYKGVPEFVGMRYSVGSDPGLANLFPKLPAISVLRNAGMRGLETDPTGLRTGKNSGYAAINLAVHFGASRIVLIGYDMGHTNGKAHFFGSHPKGLSEHERNFPAFIDLFSTLVGPLQQIGVTVINCSRSTRLECFPRQPLHQALLSPMEACA